MEEDDEYLSGRARKFVLATTLIRDACVTRLEVDYKHDLASVRTYERYYAPYNLAFHYIFTCVNLLTIFIENPPTFVVPGLGGTYYVALIINMICETFFYYRWYLIYSMSERVRFRKNVSAILTIVILIAMTLDAILYIIFSQTGIARPIRYTRVLRPLLVLTFPENCQLRAAMLNVRHIVIDIFPVFALFLASILFLGIATLTMFGDLALRYSDGLPYFQRFGDVLWELYVLSTTANSPDVIIPAYEHHRASILLYIILNVLCNILFMGILTASVYYAHRVHAAEAQLRVVATRRARLNEAFRLVQSVGVSGVGAMSQSTFIRLLRIAKPKRSEDSLRIIFHILDRDRNGYLTLNEFERLAEYMQVTYKEVELSATYFRTYVPKCYNWFISPTFQVIRRMILHKVTRFFFIFLVIMNAVTAVALRPYQNLQIVSEWFFTLAFLLELTLNFLASGGVHFFSDPWNVFDTFVVFAALFGQIVEESFSYVNIDTPTGFIQLLLVLRTLRLLKLFSVIRKFRNVIRCILHIMPALVSYSTILLVVFYMYACIAMELFAGTYGPPSEFVYTRQTTCENRNLNGTDFVAQRYCIFNFNSASESFILLLILSAVNAWQKFAHGYVVSTSTAARLFFLINHWTSVLLVLNIVTSFIIETFILSFAVRKSDFENYIRGRLRELGMDAETELQARKLQDFKKPGFYLTHEHLEEAFPHGAARSKAFIVKPDEVSAEIISYRLFNIELQQLLERYKGEKSIFKQAKEEVTE